MSWFLVLLRTVVLSIATQLIKAALTEKALKPLIIELLEHLAKQTKTDVDDTYVANIKHAMEKEDQRLGGGQ